MKSINEDMEGPKRIEAEDPKKIAVPEHSETGTTWAGNWGMLWLNRTALLNAACLHQDRESVNLHPPKQSEAALSHPKP